MSILIVEQEPAVRRSLRALLVAEGQSVHEAVDGREALRVLARIPRPALIVIDQRLPLMTGGDLLSALERDSRFEGIPRVLLFEEPASVFVAALAAMGTAVLAKPIQAAKFRYLVQRLLRGTSRLIERAAADRFAARLLRRRSAELVAHSRRLALRFATPA